MSHSLRECLLLIPSTGLDDFPEGLAADDSAALLNGWLALWQPRLLSTTHSAPRWQSANQPPHSFEGVLALAPACTESHLPSDLERTAASAGGWLVRPNQAWRPLQKHLLSTVGLELEPALPPALETEFAALGYAYLQIQLLTQQLRYSSNLDQLLFDTQVDQAAQAALSGDVGEAERLLQSCFDQLGQERDHYYSLDVSLLDVTLLAETTLGQTVGQQLNRDAPTTFVASAHLLTKMRAQSPEVATQLESALKENRAALAGGLDIERPHPLMNFESVRRDLQRGAQAYRSAGFPAPVVFTRFSFGQLCDMPLHLRRSGYSGAMLIAWQDGSYPGGSHSKFSWEAAEGTFINALAPPLVDATSPTTYLTLGRRIAESLDHQHVPVFMMAHWPGQYSSFHELLERVVKRTPAMGRWQNVNDFFEKTDQPYHQDSLPGRKFQYDWAVAAGPDLDRLIECSAAYQQLSSHWRILQNLANLCYQLENYHRQPPVTAGSEGDDPNRIGAYVERGPQAKELSQWYSELAQAADRIDELFDNPSIAPDWLESIHGQLNQLRLDLCQRMAKAAGHKLGSEGAGSTGSLLLNPSCAPQRLVHTSASEFAPAAGNWLYASGTNSRGRLSMVDLPCFGVLPIAIQPASPPARRREPTLVQGEGLLVNDFMEVQIDPRSGALRSLHVPGKRGNRLSLQVAHREKSGEHSEYSQMQLSELKTIENSPVHGLIRARGTCVVGRQTTANFEIDYELLRGQRVLTMEVRLSDLKQLSGSPWKSAYVLRTAWPSEASILSSRSCSSRQTFSSGRAIATEWIEIDDVEHRTYLFTGGLPFHQRVEGRFLESLLGNGASGKLHRKFAIGIDVPSPSVTAQAIGLPSCQQAIQMTASAPTEATWLMHIDAKHVVMQLDAPLIGANGQLAGMRVHLSEVSGKSVTARIRALREVREAHRVDYLGNRIAKLTVDGDTVSIAVRPHEMTFVDLEWS